MKRITLLASLLLIGSTLSAFTLSAQVRRPSSPPPAPAPPPVANALAGDALQRLSPAELARFNNGRQEFADVENVADGLGPVFNGRSCGECHNAPALGGGNRRLVTRIGTRTGNAFDALTNLGGSLLQDRAIGPRDGSVHPFRPEVVPAAATIVAHRRSTPLFGLGLVDATPDVVFVALAADQASRPDGTAGRVSRVQNISAGMQTVGKFGWKAQVPTLFQFSGDAYVNELGITNPQFPDENCPQGNCAELSFNPVPAINDLGDGVEALRDFMTFLAPPPRAAVISRDANDGEQLFAQIGCASCHVASLTTGRNAVAALDRVTYHPYSDFLLHDMGTLGDGIEQGSATGRELRTSPLWGLRFVQTYLHDGRANTLDQAVLAHEGQGRASRDRYSRLDQASKDKLLAFLRSL
jgi:CxxC motif-containing protein (DUF1111 family)